MVSFGSRRGEAGASSLYLMIGAFLSAAGFLAWLFVQAAPIQVEVVEGGAIEEDLPTVVPLDVFGADPLAQAGMFIQLNGVGVQSLIGSEAFFAQVPNQPSPFLMRMLPGVVESGVVVEAFARVSVVGTVLTRTDSVADAWVASGAIAESDRVLVMFAESFFEATGVTVTAPPPPGRN